MNESSEALNKSVVAEVKPLRIFNKLTAHQSNTVNELLEIITVDQPGPGGAHHEYLCYWPEQNGRVNTHTIKFQKGGIADVGVNGLKNEALLAIVKHRLESFQAGPFKCYENDGALAAVNTALINMHNRTKARLARGVEGKTDKP